MSTTKHTPGPLTVAQNSHRNMAVIVGPDDEHIAYVTGETISMQLADARRLAHCANVHDELLADFAELVEAYEKLLVDSRITKHDRKVMAEMLPHYTGKYRAAIAGAQGAAS